MASNYDPNQPGNEQYARPTDQSGYGQPQAGNTQPQYDYAAAPQGAAVATARRGNPMPAILLTLLLVAAAGAGAWFFINKGGVLAATTHSKLMPKDTLAFVTYDAKPGGTAEASLAKLRETFEAQPGFKTLWAKINSSASDSSAAMPDASKQCSVSTSLFTKAGTVKDLFNGNVTIGVVADAAKLKQMMGSNSTTNADACASIKFANDSVFAIVDLDVAKANGSGFLSKLESQTSDLGKATKDEDYSGNAIYKLTTDDQSYYATLVGREGIVSANKELIKKVLNANKDANLSLDSSAQYKASAAKLPAGRTVTFYLNLGQSIDLLGMGMNSYMANMASLGTTGSSQAQVDCMMKQLDNYDGNFMSSFTPRDNGVEIDLVSSIDTSKLPAEMQNMLYTPKAMDSRALFEQAPAGSWVVLGGQDIKGAVQYGLKSLDYQLKACPGASTTSMSSDQIKSQLKESTGLDLDEDILSWMDGEYALYVAPGGSISFPAQGAFVLSVSDSDKAKAGIAKISALLEKQMAANPDSGITMSKDGDIYSVPFSSGQSSPAMFYGLKDGKFYLAVGKSAIDGFGQGDKVTSNADYKTAFAGLLKPDTGRLYVNIGTLRQFAEAVMGSNNDSYNTNFKPLIAPFHAWGLTTQQTDKGSQQIKMFFNIQK